jgi:hypothetical protein
LGFSSWCWNLFLFSHYSFPTVMVWNGGGLTETHSISVFPSLGLNVWQWTI